MYYIAGYFVKIVLNVFGSLKVYNKEKVPKNKGYVLACTHTGWVDILWLGVSLLPTKIHYMAKKELFKTKFLKWLMEGLNAFPVDRDNPGPSSIKHPRKLIKDGEIVGIFPSGTRTTEEASLKRGAVTIATYAKSPIIPAAYVGPNNFKELLKRQKPKLIFGDPIYLSNEIPKKEAIEVMMDDLNNALRNLQKEIDEK